jgi:hypothetical protein
LILNKIYQNQQLALEDVKIMLKMFFKIKEQKIKNSSIDMFIKYMTNFNEHPFMVELQRFIPFNQIILDYLTPTIAKHIDLMEIKDIKKNTITLSYNKEKYEKLEKDVNK